MAPECSTCVDQMQNPYRTPHHYILVGHGYDGRNRSRACTIHRYFSRYVLLHFLAFQSRRKSSCAGVLFMLATAHPRGPVKCSPEQVSFNKTSSCECMDCVESELGSLSASLCMARRRLDSKLTSCGLMVVPDFLMVIPRQ
ncbi:hypothetical protein PLICRDRAFT_48836 [Plicaturopsis crispa FD-325 SS-3]|nr:hypothetical protein PLICRDRAFT_48836 [Plicaturopsis crispa FD-325 SS-3]